MEAFSQSSLWGQRGGWGRRLHQNLLLSACPGGIRDATCSLSLRVWESCPLTPGLPSWTQTQNHSGCQKLPGSTAGIAQAQRDATPAKGHLGIQAQRDPRKGSPFRFLVAGAALPTPRLQPSCENSKWSCDSELMKDYQEEVETWLLRERGV